jgi:hypothetical protein
MRQIVADAEAVGGREKAAEKSYRWNYSAV